IAKPKEIPSVTRREITNAFILLGFLAASTIVFGVLGIIFGPMLTRAFTHAPDSSSSNKAPRDDAELTQVLDELKSLDAAARRRACERLAKAEPNTPRRNEVAQALAERLLDKNGGTCDAAARTLVLWATSEQVPALVEVLDHQSGTVQKAALEALGN